MPVVNATTVTLEYRIGEGPIATIEASQSVDTWVATLPAALSDITLSYRVVMSNDEFTETTGWISVSNEIEEYSADIFAVRLQSMALLFGSLALCISIQRRMSSSSQKSLGEPEAALISADQTSMVVPTNSAVPMTMAPSLALDDPRRPAGWTDEQWLHYGPDHITQNSGGGF